MVLATLRGPCSRGISGDAQYSARPLGAADRRANLADVAALLDASSVAAVEADWRRRGRLWTGGQYSGLAVWTIVTEQATLFAGDIKLWLNGNIKRRLRGWVILSFAFVAGRRSFCQEIALAKWCWGRSSISRSRRLRTHGWGWQIVLGSARGCRIGVRGIAAMLDLHRLGLPRGGVLDTYVLRNALMVGLVMGFAVIPSFTRLPKTPSLPFPSIALGIAAGATPWQRRSALCRRQ